MFSDKEKEIRNTLIEIIYREQQCIICESRFNIVGITGIGRVRTSACKIHPNVTYNSSDNGVKTFSSEFGGACSVCKYTRPESVRTKVLIFEHNYLPRLGCTSIGHLGKPWLFISTDDMTKLNINLKAKLGKSLGNIAFNTNRVFTDDGISQTEMLLNNGIMDISRGLLILPLFIFRHIMLKQKKMLENSRNWYSENSFFNVPREYGDITDISDYKRFTTEEIENIYEHFSGKSRSLLKIGTNFRYSSKQCPETNMFIFENPARFVAEFVKISGQDEFGETVEDGHVSKMSGNTFSVNYHKPYVSVAHEKLKMKLSLFDAYNSLMVSLGMSPLQDNYFEKKVSSLSYFREIKKLLPTSRVAQRVRRTEQTTNPVTKKRIKPDPYGPSSDKQEDDEDGENERPTKRKRVSTSDEDPTGRTVLTRPARSTYGLNLSDPSSRSGLIGRDLPSSILKREQHEDMVQELPAHSTYYSTIRDKTSIDVKKTPSMRSHSTELASSIPISEINETFVGGQMIGEMQHLQHKIINGGKVGPFDPSRGIYPMGNYEATAIPGIKSKSSTRPGYKQTLTPARMKMALSRLDESTLIAESGARFGGYITNMRRALEVKELGREITQNYEMALNASFEEKATLRRKSLFLPWPGIGKSYGDIGFLPFAILLNAEFVNV